MDRWQLRHQVYDHFAHEGRAPLMTEVAAWVGDTEQARSLLHELHDSRALVLDGDGEIRMALPFSGVETPHRVVSGDQQWYANCAWDAVAIPLLLDVDARIEAPWADDGEPVDLAIESGELVGDEGFVHFARPAGSWWDDIVET